MARKTYQSWHFYELWRLLWNETETKLEFFLPLTTLAVWVLFGCIVVTDPGFHVGGIPVPRTGTNYQCSRVVNEPTSWFEAQTKTITRAELKQLMAKKSFRG